MAGNERFTYQDLIGLQSFGDLILKIKEIFNLTENTLRDKFGSVSGGVSNSSQILKHGRFAMFCSDVIGNGWSEVLVSFDFKGKTPAEGPTVVVQLYLNEDNSKFSTVIEASKKFDKASFEKVPEFNGGYMRFEKPLVSFLEKENQVAAITSWITDHIEKIADFKAQSIDIGWTEKIITP